MAVKIRGLTGEDLGDMRNQVKSQTTKHGIRILEDSMDSPEIFGTKGKKWNTRQSLTYDNARAYIHLNVPIVNRVLSQNGRLLAKILGMPAQTVKEIMDYTLVADANDIYDLIDSNSIDGSTPYLCGGELLMEYIQAFDLNSALESRILSAASGALKQGKYIEDYGFITKEKDGNLHLFQEYYFHVEDSTGLVEVLKRGRTIDSIETAVDDVLATGSSSLSILYALKGNYTPILSMINEDIVVLPSGMRPKIDGRINRITKLYNQIIQRNQEIALSKGNKYTTAYLASVKALDSAVSALQFKCLKPWELKKQKGASSVLERVSSKPGQIRKNNFGRRQDYSGRAALIVDPFLPTNTIKLPEDMIARIYKYHAIPYIKGDKFKTNRTAEETQEILKILREYGILDKVPVVFGRQPTLHKYNMLGFNVVPSKCNAIVVPPLICMWFNADFDGDSGAVQVPLSEAAIAEVKALMMAEDSPFLAKTGECVLVPRQDIIYGLYFCTRSSYPYDTANVRTYKTWAGILEHVKQNKVKAHQLVSVMGETLPAGYAAFKACFPEPERVEVKEITTKTVMQFTEFLLENYTHKQFIETTDKLTALGFIVARLYPRSLSLIKEEKSVPEYDNAMKVFDESVEPLNYLYSIGLEDADTYSLRMSEYLSRLQNTMESNIAEKIGTDCGYWHMANSGARGNKSNLAQMFSLKGRIASSSSDEITVTVKGCYHKGLDQLESFIAAYGGRQGQMEKSLKTGDTGYVSRKMWHTDDDIYIRCDDCGTTDGVTYGDKDFAMLVQEEDERRDLFEHFIVGRFEAGTNQFITKKRAKELARAGKPVTVRSPITCKNPCCVKCYGINYDTRKLVVEGTPVGVLAAQSLGEPASQLMLNSFHKGGVSNKGGMTSSFSRLSDYLNVVNIASKAASGKMTLYEPVAWETGETRVDHTGNVKVIHIGNSKKYAKVPDTANLKDYVEKGEGVCDGEVHGDYYIRELEEIMGIDYALRYLVLKVFSLYMDECKLVPVHIEVLVSCMHQYMILQTDRSDLIVGQYSDRRRLLSDSLENTRYRDCILGIDRVPVVSLNALKSIAMENVGSGLARAHIYGLKDNLEDPLVRIMLSLPIEQGTYFDSFWNSRCLDD